MKTLLGLAFILACAIGASAQSPWPGQGGNLVGYAAYGTGVLGTTATTYASLTSGSAGSPVICIGCKFTGGGTISVNFWECIACDFNLSTGGLLVSGNNITFSGSRFQSNDLGNYNVQTTGSNIVFSYSSVTPLASFYTAPPGSLWPTAGAATNSILICTTGQSTAGCNGTTNNSIDGNQGYQYGINITSGGPVTIDHCDIWGFGNSVVFYTTTAQMTITNSWIHDPANPNYSASSPILGQGYHVDGPGYLNGAGGTTHVTMIGNTICMLGNTNSLAFQAATSGYTNMRIENNYFCGNEDTISPGDVGPTFFSNSDFAYNLFGTDVEPGGAVSHGFNFGSGFVWANNTVAFRSGTTWGPVSGYTPVSGDNGKFWVESNSAPASATDVGSNTIGGALAPSSLNFLTQATSSTSAGKTITLTSSNSGTLTVTGAASLAVGTQFSIFSTTCTSASLTTAQSCNVVVKFTPTAVGVQQDTLSFTTNSPGFSSPQIVPLIGVGCTVTDCAQPQVATPTFLPVSGTYTTTQSVAITTATGGSTICYTTDGSTPTGNNGGTCTHGTTLANGGTVSVAVSETLQAIGTLSGDVDSAVGSAAYVINSGLSHILSGSAVISGGAKIQ